MNKTIAVIVSLGLTVGAVPLRAAEDNRFEITRDYPLERVSERVYVIFGPNEPPTPANKGFQNNPGIVLTNVGIVIIDPGSSVYTGSYVLKRARELDSARVVAVFNTHSHGNHWLGNQAIKEAYPTAVVYAHPKAKELAEQGEGERWIKAINQRTGGTLAGTYPVGPGRSADEGDTIEIGGVHFRIHHTGPAHTESDIMIEVLEERVLFFGDIVRSQNVSEFMESVTGNIDAIDRGLATDANRFVPGHGPGLDGAMVQNYRGFLATLRSTLTQFYNDGMASYEVKPLMVAALKDYRSWSGFDDHIGRLIHAAYLEVEQESFGGL